MNGVRPSRTHLSSPAALVARCESDKNMDPAIAQHTHTPTNTRTSLDEIRLQGLGFGINLKPIKEVFLWPTSLLRKLFCESGSSK